MEDDVPANVNEEEQGGCCPKRASSLVDARLPYLIVMFVLTVASGCFILWGGEFYHKVNACPDKCLSAGDPDQCCASIVVYRIMFGAFWFFVTLAIISKIPSCSNLSAGGWCYKILYLAGLLVVGFVIPHQVLEGFRVLWILISAVFLVIQIILMLDFAISWNEDWVERNWKGAILVCAFILYATSLAAFIILWMYMTNGENCSQEKAFVIITFIVTLLFTIISVSSEKLGKGVLPVATVTLYCYWLLYSALSDNLKSCNKWATQNGDDVFEVLLGFFTAALTVTYAGFNVSRKTKKLRTTRSGTVVDQDGNPVQAGVSAFNFHATMSASAAYAAMTLTEWGLQQNAVIPLDTIPRIVYVQMASQWACMLLFAWVLFAPVLLPHREFDF